MSQSRDFIEVLSGLEHAPPERGIVLVDRRFRETAHSYAELHRRSMALANAFRARGVRKGDRVLVSLVADVNSICSFLALMYIGAVPVSVASPLVSQDRGSYLDGLARTVSIAGVHRILASEGLENLVEGDHRLATEVTALEPRVAATRNDATEIVPASVDADDTAFIQFSSGSTSHPKGIRITHRNLLYNLTLIVQNDRRTESSVTVSWLPLCHDMGLVGCLLSNFVLRNDLVLMHPLCFLMRPVSWLAAITKARGTVTAIPNFGLDVCVDRITDAQLREHAVDLTSFRYVYCGSEPVNPESIARFEDKFAPFGFSPGSIRPVYGMSECTLIVTAPDPGGKLVTRSLDGIDVVSVGRPLGDFRLRIADGNGNDPGPGVVGEIWIRGTSVSPGYVDATRSSQASVDGGWLRTGDLGLMDDEGRLYVTGRKKDLIIHQGRNFYGHDIVSRLEELPFHQRGKVHAFGTMVNGEEELVVMTVPPPEGLPPRFEDEIRRCVLSEFGLPVHDVVQVKRIPKTTSGKTDRGRCERTYRRIRGQSAGEHA